MRPFGQVLCHRLFFASCGLSEASRSLSGYSRKTGPADRFWHDANLIGPYVMNVDHRETFVCFCKFVLLGPRDWVHSRVHRTRARCSSSRRLRFGDWPAVAVGVCMILFSNDVPPYVAGRRHALRNTSHAFCLDCTGAKAIADMIQH